MNDAHIRTLLLLLPLLCCTHDLLLLRLVHLHLVLFWLRCRLRLCAGSVPGWAVLAPQVHSTALAEGEDATEERKNTAAEHGGRARVGEPTQEVIEGAEEDEGLAFLRDHALRETFGTLLYP